MSTTVILKNVRLSFPELYKARSFEGGGKARYSASFLVEPGSENDKLIKEAINAAAKEAWKDEAGKKLKMYYGQKGQCCYLSGDNKEYEGYEGMMVLSAHRNEDKGAPKVVDRAKQDLPVSSGKIYAGCYVNAKVDIWIQADKYPGIRAGLQVVQFVKDGEPLSGGGAPTADDMPSLDEDIDDEDLLG